MAMFPIKLLLRTEKNEQEAKRTIYTEHTKWGKTKTGVNKKKQRTKHTNINEIKMQENESEGVYRQINK
jgi:hypothetical protein